MGQLVALAEAGFLQDALREAGINAAVRASPGKHNAERRAHSVVVTPDDLDAALVLRGSILPEDRQRRDEELLAPKRELSAFDKAAGAGLMGLLVGLRVGRGSPSSTAIYCLLFGGTAFVATFWCTGKGGDEA